jgi:hypothetical protein
MCVAVDNVDIRPICRRGSWIMAPIALPMTGSSGGRSVTREDLRGRVGERILYGCGRMRTL